MDSILNEKLNQFSAVVLSDAQKKRAEIEAENEMIKKQKNDEAQNEFLKDAYEKIQSAVTKIRREDNEKVLMAGVNARKEIFAAREKIIEDVFNEIKENLLSFTKTPDYAQWLKRQIQKAAEEIGEGEKTVFARKEDMELVNRIIKDIPGENAQITAEEIGEDILGGVKVRNDVHGIISDCTFDELLAGKKADFLNRSGLSIE